MSLNRYYPTAHMHVEHDLCKGSCPSCVPAPVPSTQTMSLKGILWGLVIVLPFWVAIGFLCRAYMNG